MATAEHPTGPYLTEQSGATLRGTGVTGQEPRPPAVSVSDQLHALSELVAASHRLNVWLARQVTIVLRAAASNPRMRRAVEAAAADLAAEEAAKAAGDAVEL